jgi:antirestriction protein ArdC
MSIKQSTYELVTNQIIKALEQKIVPWKMPW